jgi:hypothetical protein
MESAKVREARRNEVGGTVASTVELVIGILMP